MAKFAFCSDIFLINFFIFSDRSALSNHRDGDIFDPAPPVFTPQTRNGPRIYRKSFSEPFQVQFSL